MSENKKFRLTDNSKILVSIDGQAVGNDLKLTDDDLADLNELEEGQSL